MNNQTVKQVVIVEQTTIDQNLLTEKTALFDAAGTPVGVLTAATTGDAVLLTGMVAGPATTALATDTVNEAIAKLQAQIDALP